MRITSSVEYAMRVMVRLAELKSGQTASAAGLAELENIPRDYVDQLLLRLRRSGLVLSRRGASGGYALARPAAEVSVGMVVRAVDRSIFESVCDRYAEGAQACTHASGSCGIRPVWQRLAFLVEAYLDKLTLADLLEQESRVALLFGSPNQEGAA